MRGLLDTHVVLWWLADDDRLSAAHRELISEPVNELFVSAVTVAEVSIKASLGKLGAPAGFNDAVRESGFRELPFTASHAEELRHLPWHHRDPFDRMLVAQALVERLEFVTADARLGAYSVRCV
ncbi:type II toxin-antitoxin system VapC family toxin [Mycolicibacter sp. MYC123]|uniref:Type II toxin-antitoxin system VapC family toxin n=1 Tax=[Mycobacterium] zoologicum TaxID=2872311 RepID=A0ABU5YGG6_9MYCO|nr:type II toxin-antitoxin system VapC family toxin [Mycolicibacter sp. MYC123]MEB3049156.1 type II toxin-antitoxin system VapC family toxin [Mycolicibacter sp. MYC123]